jgi:hypothetical protein
MREEGNRRVTLAAAITLSACGKPPQQQATPEPERHAKLPTATEVLNLRTSSDTDCSSPGSDCGYSKAQAYIDEHASFPYAGMPPSITHSLRSMIRFRHSTQIVPAIPPRSVSMCEPRDQALGFKTAESLIAPGQRQTPSQRP